MDKAYDIQANIIQQQVIAEAVKVKEIETQARVKVQQAELLRYELEVRTTTVLEADALAKAIKARGIAEAEVVRVRGQAEAEAIFRSFLCHS